MPCIALSIWDTRIAPLFDTARHLLVINTDTQHSEEHTVAQAELAKIQELTAMGVEVLICGAISRTMQDMLVTHGVRVIGFIAGSTTAVLEAWNEHRLDDSFAMPGCQRRQRQGRGKRGTHEHQGWPCPHCGHTIT